MLRLKVLGGGRQVGKNALLLEGRRTQFLLDYGVDISGPEPEFPLHVRPRDLTGLFITHAHLDHSGAAPLLYVSAKPRLFLSRLTLELSDLLISDFMKLSKYYIPYEYAQVEEMKSNSTFVKDGSEIEENGVLTRFRNAGHIPGSLMLEIEIESMRVLYTGDFNTVDTCLLNGANIDPFKENDVVIMEGTYAAFNHPNRSEVEKAFINDLLEVLDSGGNVLVPTFAVGRAQEILCVIAKHGVKYPVYVDGMARRVNMILSENSEFLREPELFRNAVNKAIHVSGWRDRRRALESPSIIVSPAAMLKGGSSVHYAKEIVEDSRNAIFFVSYLMRETPARKLLETGSLQLETLQKKVNARVEWYDFSSHCGRLELMNVLEKLDSDTKIVFIHAEEEVGKEFSEYVARTYDIKVFYPSEGEILELT
ncbi:MAG: MBL fold metallo-hydrolase [Thermofilaceae archaeon]|nr:MBL fold metallo-hydrolase [Thermofilaceae archaeon]